MRRFLAWVCRRDLHAIAVAVPIGLTLGVGGGLYAGPIQQSGRGPTGAVVAQQPDSRVEVATPVEPLVPTTGDAEPATAKPKEKPAARVARRVAQPTPTPTIAPTPTVSPEPTDPEEEDEGGEDEDQTCDPDGPAVDCESGPDDDQPGDDQEQEQDDDSNTGPVET